MWAWLKNLFSSHDPVDKNPLFNNERNPVQDALSRTPANIKKTADDLPTIPDLKIDELGSGAGHNPYDAGEINRELDE